MFTLFLLRAQAQSSNYRVKHFDSSELKDTLFLDSLSIYAPTFQVFCGNTLVDSSNYFLDPIRSRFYYRGEGDSIQVVFRVFPISLGRSFSRYDTTMVFRQNKGSIQQYALPVGTFEDLEYSGYGLTKTGSISRGLTFGNNQDLGVNSTLNLELSGDLAPNLKLLASVSDDNIPIQPDGNTAKLQEFDQVFIQVYNDHLKLIAGDFWLSRPTGYFMNYKKRAQGLTIENSWKKDSIRSVRTQFSAALSKGKFCRQIIQGIEANQGPYRLIGADNEPFIVVLAGTERVYLDGRLLERGQDKDYTINYNGSEVTFTAKNLITKDIRIVVEFQYSDQNYTRSLVQNSTTFTSKKTDAWINAYSEQDAKNQPLQQALTTEQKIKLYQVGDTLQLAQTTSIDSVGFLENQLLYKMVDSLGYDSVLVFSVDPMKAVFRATFLYVGPGNGDYQLDAYNALGKVYRWVSPVGGIHQGDFAPVKIVSAPKQKQMISTGFRTKFGKRLELESEASMSKNDLNLFSPFNSSDDIAGANHTKLSWKLPLMHPDWLLKTTAELEALGKYFVPIEQYRSVEFDRDWNTRGKGYTGNQVYGTGQVRLQHTKNGDFSVNGQYYSIGTAYLGRRALLTGNWDKNGLRADIVGSYTSSSAETNNEFLRHKLSISKDFKWLKIGYIDDHERNRFANDTSLTAASYQFFDYQFFIATGDSVPSTLKIFYRERYDQRSDSVSLVPVAKARTIGAEYQLKETTSQSLNCIVSYRQLAIRDTNLLKQQAERTLLGRVDHELKIWKGAFTMNHFYEVGSGLELRKTFLYIKVNDGQGIYSWVDYNADGIKDLNEFEIAQFIDQASYIRVFSPSNEYVTTYSNEFNQSIIWRPEKLWGKKTGWKKVASRFSDQARVRINRKTTLLDPSTYFNPYALVLTDTNLISSNSSLKNTVFFNRTSSIFNGEYTYNQVSAKNLLASGFDSKENRYQELTFRWNVQKKFTFELKAQQGCKQSIADYTAGRNYQINYNLVQPSISYQPTTSFRISLDTRFVQKINAPEFGTERSTIQEYGSSMKWNKSEKSSFQVQVKFLSITYQGVQNSPVGFELLEALKPGMNQTWNLGYQYSISKTVQLSIQYSGRQSEGVRTIHTGGMELRAFF